MKKIKILCLDQSTKLTGYSLWNFNKKNLLRYGCVKSDTNEKNPLERMKNMHYEIKKLIDTYKPDYVVLEHTISTEFFYLCTIVSITRGFIYYII